MTHIAQVIGRSANKVIGSATANGAVFGSALAATDDYLVVGAPLADVGAADTGSIYIYERDPVTDLWAEVSAIHGGATNYMLGDCVAVAGDIIAAAATRYDSYSGAVYIYRRIAGAWTATQTILNPEAGAGTFGRNMMLSQDASKLVIANIGSQLKGWAWGYTYNSGTGLYEQTNDYRPGDQAGGDCFGCSIAISPNGQHVAVGSYKDSMSVADGGSAVSQAGSVYVMSPGGTHKLRSSAPSAGGFFGRMVGLGNSTLAVSAPGEDSSRGYLHIFKWSGSAWTHTYRLSAVGGNPSYLLGYQGHQGAGFTIGRCMNHLTVCDDRIVIVPSLTCDAYDTGHKGIVWVFDTVTGEAYGVARETPRANSNMGVCAAVSKGRLLVGAPLLTEGNTASSGAVYETDAEDWDPSYGTVTPDTTAPTITLVSPAADGTPIGPKDPLVFDVQDETSLAHIEVRAKQNGVYETVYNGTAIVSPYTGTVTEISPTHLRFSVVRAGAGWLSAVGLSVTPIDHAGNKV